MKTSRMKWGMAAWILGALLTGALAAAGDSETAFVYQGRLTDGLEAASGAYDFLFRLYDAAEDGAPIGEAVARNDVEVSGSLFEVELNFGHDLFTGEACYLEIGVRPEEAGGAYTALTPRQAFIPVPSAWAYPYALYGAEVRSGAAGQGAIVTAIGIGKTDGNGVSPLVSPPHDVGAGLFSILHLGASNAAGGNYSSVGGGHSNTIATGAVYSTISGGRDNDVAVNVGYVAIGGGYGNDLEAVYSAVGGGSNNDIVVGADYGFIGGGQNNAIDAARKRATIGGGYTNRILANSAVIGGGYQNLIKTGADKSTISGGQDNKILVDAEHAVVGGGKSNTAGARYSCVVGGQGNDIAATANEAVIGGGSGNDIADYASNSLIGGGLANNVRESASYTVISGGYDHDLYAKYCAVGGGYDNNIAEGADFATIGGGEYNDIGANAKNATVAGGRQNDANKIYAAVGGGYLNKADGDGAFVGGGRYNEASGLYACVPGGRKNRAVAYSFASGYRARAAHAGCFVWGDKTEANVATSADNQFLARAKGGVKFYTNAAMTSGAKLNPGGGSWVNLSDRECKENFEAVDGRDVLERLADMPVRTWNYKSQDASIRHMGATSQDLHAAFGLGADDRGIVTVDGIGVTMAAVQGLNQKIEERDAEIETLKTRLSALEKALGAQGK
jgi:hypothetical protein